MKRKTDNFSKFYNKKNNAAIKEAFRQEKKAAKKERKEAIEKHFEEKRKARTAIAEANAMKNTGAPVDPRAKGPAGTHAKSPVHSPQSIGEILPLNKYIAHGGICSR